MNFPRLLIQLRNGQLKEAQSFAHAHMNAVMEVHSSSVAEALVTAITELDDVIYELSWDVLITEEVYALYKSVVQDFLKEENTYLRPALMLV